MELFLNYSSALNLSITSFLTKSEDIVNNSQFFHLLPTISFNVYSKIVFPIPGIPNGRITKSYYKLFFSSSFGFSKEI